MPGSRDTAAQEPVGGRTEQAVLHQRCSLDNTHTHTLSSLFGIVCRFIAGRLLPLFRSHLSEEQPVGDVLRQHEARHQVVDGAGFSAVRAKDEGVKALLPGDRQTDTHSLERWLSGLNHQTGHTYYKTLFY